MPEEDPRFEDGPLTDGHEGYPWGARPPSQRSCGARPCGRRTPRARRRETGRGGGTLSCVFRQPATGPRGSGRRPQRPERPGRRRRRGGLRDFLRRWGSWRVFTRAIIICFLVGEFVRVGVCLGERRRWRCRGPRRRGVPGQRPHQGQRLLIRGTHLTRARWSVLRRHRPERVFRQRGGGSGRRIQGFRIVTRGYHSCPVQCVTRVAVLPILPGGPLLASTEAVAEA